MVRDRTGREVWALVRGFEFLAEGFGFFLRRLLESHWAGKVNYLDLFLDFGVEDGVGE